MALISAQVRPRDYVSLQAYLPYATMTTSSAPPQVRDANDHWPSPQATGRDSCTRRAAPQGARTASLRSSCPIQPSRAVDPR